MPVLLYRRSRIRLLAVADFAASASNTKLWKAIYRGDLASMELADVAGFDFRPKASSPLRGAGYVYPPYSPATAGGGAPDVGAYQFGEERWLAGCSFTPSCA